MLSDSDKFKQRAGGEVLTGLVRGMYSWPCNSQLTYGRVGSKHWTRSSSDQLWAWVTGRLDRIFAEIKPDTLTFWETAIAVRTHGFVAQTSDQFFLQHMLEDRDPRRNQPLVDWILSLSLDFSGDSAFQSRFHKSEGHRSDRCVQ